MLTSSERFNRNSKCAHTQKNMTKAKGKQTVKNQMSSRYFQYHGKKLNNYKVLGNKQEGSCRNYKNDQ